MRRRRGETNEQISRTRLFFTNQRERGSACLKRSSRTLALTLVALLVARQFNFGNDGLNWWSVVRKSHEDISIPSDSHAVQSADHTEIPPWMQAYVNFHNSSIYFDRGTFHLKPDAKYLVYYCHAETTCGGIGDRLNGIMSLLYLAMCTERVLVIDMPSPYPIEDVLLPNLIQWNIQYPSNTNYTYHKLGKSRTWGPFLDPSQLDASIRGWVVTTGHWVGQWLWDSDAMKRYQKQHSGNCSVKQDPHYMYRWGFWTLFRFSDKVLQRAQQFKMAANLTRHQQQTLPYTAIHVRTGNGGAGSSFRDPPRHTGHDTFRQFLQCGRLLEHELNKSNATRLGDYRRDILILSDSVETKSLIQSWDTVGNVKTVSGVNVFHVDKSKPRPLTKQYWIVNRRQANLDAWAELVLLVDSECLVRSRSGFSEVAHRIVASNLINYHRCGIKFDNCTDANVQEVVAALDPTDNTTTTVSDNVWVANEPGEA